MKKLKKIFKDLLSVLAVSLTVFILFIFNSRETINVIDEESASQKVNYKSEEVQVNFRCETDKQFATYLTKFMSANKDLNIEKIDSSVKNEFDVTFSRVDN